MVAEGSLGDGAVPAAGRSPGLSLPFSGCPAAASRQSPPWGCWGVPTLPCLPQACGGRTCQCHPWAPHPSRGQGLATVISLPLLPPLPQPLFGAQGHLSPCPKCPLLLCLGQILPTAQPGCSGDDLGHWYQCWGPSNASSPWGAGTCLPLVPGLGQPFVTSQTAVLAPHMPSGITCAWLGLLALPWPGTSLGMPEREGHMEAPGDSEHLCTLSAAHRSQGCALCLLPMSCSPFPAPLACTTLLLAVLCSLCLLPMPVPALLPWLEVWEPWGSGAGEDNAPVCVCTGWRTGGVPWGEKGCGCLCHVCAIAWGSEVQPGGLARLGSVWGDWAGTGGWVCRSQRRAGA